MVRREETERDDGRGKMGSSSVDSAPSMQQSVGARVATSALYKRKGDKKKRRVCNLGSGRGDK